MCVFSQTCYVIIGKQIADNKGPQAKAEPEVPEQSLPEFSELSQPDQKSQADMLDFNDEFVPGTTCE